MHRRFLTGLLLLSIVPVIADQSARAQFCVPLDEGPAYKIYDYNNGACTNCTQDWDMDFAEYCAFLSSNSAYLGTGFSTPVVADVFGASCGLEDTHGMRVEEYFEFSCNAEAAYLVETQSYATWAAMINYLAGTYGEGTVVNLSNGPPGTFSHTDANAISAAYDAGILLILVQGMSLGSSWEDDLAQKKLNCAPMNATGGFVFGFDPTNIETNLAIVGVPTNYHTGSEYLIARTGTSSYGAATSESGSFSTPLLAGSVVHIVEAVGSRDGVEPYTIERVLDYIISACDRPDDPEDEEDDFSFRTAALPSLAPWSDVYAYGVYSPWKALLYAYGFGVLEAKDYSLDENPNPPTIFSDHFELRGDLSVPSGQTFVVSPLASVNIVTEEPEGPDLGLDEDVHEIFVVGDMLVQSSLQDGVYASVVVDDGGTCTVEDGGTITIGSAMTMLVAAGGTLAVEDGGSLIIESGGTLVVDGSFSLQGALVVEGEFTLTGVLTAAAGAAMEFQEGAVIDLQSDLVIPSGASLSAAEGVSITVASEDASAGGSDTDRVEITCQGEVDFAGTVGDPIVIAGATSGPDEWVGISYTTTGAITNTFEYVHVSDADIGVYIAGSASIAVDNATITACNTGIQFYGRLGLAVNGGDISDCTVGIDLVLANIAVTGAAIHDTGTGIQCYESNPVVRDCHIYGNTKGIEALESESIPDLGTSASPGNNNFAGPLNSIHVSAFDPWTDIPAQYNWWGTTKVPNIMARIVVFDLGDPGAGSVVIAPVLTSAPSARFQPPMAESAEAPGEPEDHAQPRVRFGLAQNTPNPFNPVTRIAFATERDEVVKLTIHDVRGSLVRTLVDGRLPAGVHSREWDGRDAGGRPLSSGVYFYRLTTSHDVATRKAVLLK